MRKLQLKLCLLGTVLAILISSRAYSANGGLDIPLISAEPEFSDFQGMSPSTALALSMTKVADFTQRTPDDGDAATQRTEVYIGYDHEQLHAIFLAFDSEPDQIRANLSSRESIDGDDNVEITIDTFNDQRAAFSFRSTAM